MISLEEFKKALRADVSEFTDGYHYKKNDALTKAWQGIFGSSIRAVYCIEAEFPFLISEDTGVNIEHYMQYILTEKGRFYVYGSEWGGIYEA